MFHSMFHFKMLALLRLYRQTNSGGMMSRMAAMDRVGGIMTVHLTGTLKSTYPGLQTLVHRNK